MTEYVGSECQRKIGELLQEVRKRSAEIEAKEAAAKDRAESRRYGREWDLLNKEFGRKRKELLIQYGYWDENGPIKKRTQE